MVDYIIRKPLGLVLLATAHMVFNGPSQAKLTGILGSNITLLFRFHDTFINESSHLAVYTTGQRKIAECSKSKCNLILEIYQNTSVLYHIKKLQLNGSGIYWASLFPGSGPTIESDKVQLLVQDGNGSVTVSPLPTNTTIFENHGNSSVFSFHHIAILVAPVVLLAAALTLLIWCLVRTKEKQQPQQNSNHTVQETVAGSHTVPPPSLIYSVLDFARRPPAALDKSLDDTEYTAVTYP
ncbi:uncharacterized protein [Paralichthys olivaceus]|uniref:uncharacterized protein n=1 Tax=Paralichthys olivaceus TaxID=8255 RepID=UPI0037532061